MSMPLFRRRNVVTAVRIPCRKTVCYQTDLRTIGRTCGAGTACRFALPIPHPLDEGTTSTGKPATTELPTGVGGATGVISVVAASCLGRRRGAAPLILTAEPSPPRLISR